MLKGFTILLLAGAAALPGLAQAQERDDRPRAEGERARPQAPRQAPPAAAPAPRAQPQVQGQPQGQPRAQVAPGGGGRPDFQGGQRGYQGQPGGYAQGRAPGQAVPQAAAPGVDARGGFRPGPDGVYRRDGGQAQRGYGDPRAGGQPGGYARPQGYVQGQQGYDRQQGYDQRRDPRGYDRGQFAGQRPGYGDPRRGGAGQAWNRGWHSDRNYDWQRYRYANRDLYRLPRYDAPYGWGYGYQRFGIGFTLSSILFAQDYWIDDPYAYRLPPAYGPYRWVRYYNDALLVDVRTGQVVDTAYGIFW